MTSEPRLPDYLRHMQEAAQENVDFTAGMDLAAFLADGRTQKAVFFNFVILGEAATRLMAGHADFLAQHPQVPWRSIRDMRNQVAHGYVTIDTDVVWHTVRVALPDLLTKLPSIISAADALPAASIPPTAAS
jgi:uncharacterized protein with HEPN domain